MRLARAARETIAFVENVAFVLILGAFLLILCIAAAINTPRGIDLDRP